MRTFNVALLVVMSANHIRASFEQSWVGTVSGSFRDCSLSSGCWKYSMLIRLYIPFDNIPLRKIAFNDTWCCKFPGRNTEITTCIWKLIQKPSPKPKVQRCILATARNQNKRVILWGFEEENISSSYILHEIRYTCIPCKAVQTKVIISPWYI